VIRDDQYSIRGGVEGRARLRVLGRVLHPTTSSLLDGLSLQPGMSCLDVGCGGGDVTVELARRVGPTGHVLGIDVDETTLEVAREEAKERGIGNVEFTAADIRAQARLPEFDLVYARFLLTHLEDPGSVIEVLRDLVRPEGVLAAEDIDFSGAYTYPESDAYRRYHELYLDVVRRRGGDPNIGRRLPVLLVSGGFEDVRLSVVQPMAISGEAKLLNPLTMRNIADTVVRDGLAPKAEVDAIVDELHRFAHDPGTIAGLPRIVQAWGIRPRRRPLVADHHHI
jgi:SAM-dependent methyltransferase